MNKLYRVYEHNNKDYNHLYIEVISNEGSTYSDGEPIFNISWQQTAGDYQYYAIRYNFSNSKNVDLFYKIVKKIQKNNIDYNTQPFEVICFLEKLGYRQCEYYDVIGYTECKKVENPNNKVYDMFVENKHWTTKLANKNTYKKQIPKQTRFSSLLKEVTFQLSPYEEQIKSKKKFNINKLKEECIFFKGTNEEKTILLRKKKLENILSE